MSNAKNAQIDDLIFKIMVSLHERYCNCRKYFGMCVELDPKFHEKYCVDGDKYYCPYRAQIENSAVGDIWK